MMAQSMLRSLALVMFCESDMPTTTRKSRRGGIKLLLDIQVKTMMGKTRTDGVRAGVPDQRQGPVL